MPETATFKGSALAKARSNVAVAYRRKLSSEAKAKAHRDFAAEKIAHYVEKTLAGWPPLTDEQLDRIAALLRAGSRGGDHANT